MKNAKFINCFQIGGYHHTSSAKLWAILTHAIISGCHEIPSLDKLVPEHEFWPSYLDDESLQVLESPENDSGETNKIKELKNYIEKTV